jgi:serine/threonine protein kinase
MANRVCPSHGILSIDEEYCPTKKCGVRAALADGTLLNGGKYRITRKVAEGGMATIYEAIDSSGLRVAIKEIRVLPNPADPNKLTKALANFEAEGRILRNISSSLFPTGYDSWDEFDTKFMALEFINGQDFEQKAQAQGGTMTDEMEIIKFGVAVLQGLEILHAMTPQIIHRDIKPANVMEDVTGRIILMDLGISKHFDRTAGTGTMIGTPGYDAMEQALGRAEPRSDLYSTAMSVVRLKLGPQVTAFDWDERLDLVDQLPLSWQGMMRRALAVEPDNRQADVSELIKDLTGLLPAQAPITQPLIPRAASQAQAPPAAPVPSDPITLMFDGSTAGSHGKHEYRQPVSGTVHQGTATLPNIQITPYIMDFGNGLIYTGQRQAVIVTDNFGRFSLPSRMITVPLTVDRREITLKVADPANSRSVACQEEFTISRPAQAGGFRSWLPFGGNTTPTTGTLTPLPRPVPPAPAAGTATATKRKVSLTTISTWIIALAVALFVYLGLKNDNISLWSFAVLAGVFAFSATRFFASKPRPFLPRMGMAIFGSATLLWCMFRFL